MELKKIVIKKGTQKDESDENRKKEGMKEEEGSK